MHSLTASTHNYPFNQTPLYHRRGIDFYIDKTGADFQRDPYERYREMVVRQLAIHYGDAHWGNYSFQVVIDWLVEQLSSTPDQVVMEIGCGVGRLLSELANIRPDWRLLGIDYSYNLLRSCHQLWQKGEALELDYRERGLPLLQISGQVLPLLQLGLASAEKLPIADASVDVIANTFLLDRLAEPALALAEWHRVLRPNGQLLIVTPLNWQSTNNWKCYGQVVQVEQLFAQHGWHILVKDQLEVREPLDTRGNFVGWQLLAWSLEKQ